MVSDCCFRLMGAAAGAARSRPIRQRARCESRERVIAVCPCASRGAPGRTLSNGCEAGLACEREAPDELAIIVGFSVIAEADVLEHAV